MEAKSGRIGHAHLIAYPIVDQKDADVRHHIPVAKRVHVVEEGKITYNHEMQSVGFSQGRSECGGQCPIDAEAARIAITTNRRVKLKVVPTAKRIEDCEMHNRLLGNLLSGLLCYPSARIWQIGKRSSQ